MSGSFGDRIVMMCIVCNSAHHDQKKEVYIQDEKGAWGKKVCPMCCCLDCVQTGNDPVRAHLRPLVMGQTLQSQYNLNVEERKPGQEPTRKTISIKGPGPLNVREAIRAMGDVLGLEAPTPPPRHNIGVACGCGKNAVSKCISCEVPLCMKCLKIHECE